MSIHVCICKDACTSIYSNTLGHFCDKDHSIPHISSLSPQSKLIKEDIISMLGVLYYFTLELQEESSDIVHD